MMQSTVGLSLTRCPVFASAEQANVDGVAQAGVGEGLLEAGAALDGVVARLVVDAEPGHLAAVDEVIARHLAPRTRSCRRG